MNINEIAKLAGVSRATVSRYLNHGYVSEEKKEQISKVIQETGYQPSVSAQTLRSKRTNYIGVIIPKIDSASIARMVKGIIEVLSEAGFQLMLACTNNNEKDELKYLNLFKENHVDGIILLGTIITREHKRLLSQLAVPVVILGQYLKDYTCIYHDDYGAAKALVSTLCTTAGEWGYLSVTESDQAVGRNRTAGITDALEEKHISLLADHIMTCEFTTESGYKKTEELLKRHPGIDTLLCATDTIAVGALKYIHDSGLRIPEDIQLAGFGDSTVSRVTTPTLTTVHFHYETAGREATRILLDMIKDPENTVQKQLKLSFQIIENESTRN
ncbi:MAG: LacI family DNA-binding transcriptional regulator [Lachnospiraceae bacterium]|nr:LacI family DNA-binding transcriptional regulator [Lachnospiraceae bacterium]